MLLHESFHTLKVWRTDLWSRGFECAPQGGATPECDSCLDHCLHGDYQLDRSHREFSCKNKKKALGRSYFYTKRLIRSTQKCFPSNALVFGDETDVKGIEVSLVFAR